LSRAIPDVTPEAGQENGWKRAGCGPASTGCARRTCRTPGTPRRQGLPRCPACYELVLPVVKSRSPPRTVGRTQIIYHGNTQSYEHPGNEQSQQPRKTIILARPCPSPRRSHRAAAVRKASPARGGRRGCSPPEGACSTWMGCHSTSAGSSPPAAVCALPAAVELPGLPGSLNGCLSGAVARATRHTASAASSRPAPVSCRRAELDRRIIARVRLARRM